jgi:ABC-type transport system involved in multi-copper enzyme maturation permease subunit
LPVYDLAYRRTPYDRKTGGGLAEVFRRTVRAGLRSRWTKILLALSWIPAVVACGYLYLRSGAIAGFAPPGVPSVHFEPRQYYFLANFSRVFLLIFSVAVGSGAIAEDRRNHAFELYFARPLSPLEYLGGKLLGLSFLLFSMTGLPWLTVWLFDASLVAEGESPRFAESAYLLPRLAGYALVLSVATALFVLAFSANSRSGRHAAIFFAIFFLLSQPVAELLGEIVRSDGVRALGYWRCFEAIAREIFEVPRGFHEPPFRAATVVLLAGCAIAAGALRSGVRPTRVVR